MLLASNTGITEPISSETFAARQGSRLKNIENEICTICDQIDPYLSPDERHELKLFDEKSSEKFWEDHEAWPYEHLDELNFRSQEKYELEYVRFVEAFVHRPKVRFIEKLLKKHHLLPPTEKGRLTFE
jgi:hypothetical protein